MKLQLKKPKSFFWKFIWYELIAFGITLLVSLGAIGLFNECIPNADGSCTVKEHICEFYLFFIALFIFLSFAVFLIARYQKK